MKQVVFRADSSKYIGTGHVMRCLTLAEGLVECGVQSVTFICRDLPGNIIHIIKERYDVVTLPFDVENYSAERYESEYDFWLGVPKEHDRKETAEVLKAFDCDMLIVDHYALDYEWETPLRQLTSKIFVIDDLANRKHDCDFLLDQNIYVDLESRYKEKVCEETFLFLGGKYALIRPEFLNIKKRRIASNQLSISTIKRVLLYLGGVDKENFTLKVLKAINNVHGLSVEIDVVVGIANPHSETVATFCNKNKHCNYFCQPSHFHELIAKADYCIGAAGSSSLERWCVGLPTSVFITAKNQEKLAVDAERMGLLKIIDGSTQYTIDREIQKILSFFNQDEIRDRIKKGICCVDGFGVSRVVEKITN